MNIIQVKNLHKKFKNVNAVNGISFNVKEGELFAFLGVNGAGKSTTINILCGDLIKDNGEIFVNGYNLDKNLDEIKQILGVVYQDSVLDKQLTVKDNLECRGYLYNLTKQQLTQRIDEIDRLLNIKKLLNRPIGKLSGGQRRRIDIARAILHNPKILILDEPTTGLDPQTRKMVWNVINRLRVENKITVFLTTHYMEETAEADYVVILDNGEIVAQGSPYQLKNEFANDVIKLYNTTEYELQKTKIPYKKHQDHFVIEIENTKQATELIIKNPEIFQDYEIIKGNMDDVFLSVTGKQLMQGENNEKLL